ncbi:MAG: SH3 domain-containing protein [Chloroflexi bacterium]|nr:SH3 domain-containing protein [Chloroflexota bacterium]
MRKVVVLAIVFVGILSLSLAMLPTTQHSNLTIASVNAQDASCSAQLDTAVSQTLELCGATARGQLCWGAGVFDYSPKEVEISAPGGTVPLAGISAVINNSSSDQTSITRLNFEDTFSEGGFASAFLIGPVTATADSEKTPLWSSLTLTRTEAQLSDCEVAQTSGMLLQAPTGQLLVLTVNGVTLTMNNTAFVLIAETGETVIDVLRGNAIAQIGSSVQVVFAGFSITAPANPNALPIPVPYDQTSLTGLPTQLLPSIVIVPLPGNVSAQATTPLYASPDLGAPQLAQVLPGTILNLLGEDTTAQWWNVVQEDGQSGWVPTTAIAGIFPATAPQYSATPQPPTRPYGLVLGRGTAPGNEINMRASPSTDAEILAKLPALTEFNILGRNAAADWIQIRLDTPDTTTGATDGWVAVRIVTLPNSLRVADLPVVP